jgi:monoamine oxidase
MFNVGGGTRWLPWIIAHPGVWPTVTILRKIAKARPPDVSARQFIEKQRYRGRARILAEMTLTAHLPGTVDEIGLQGLVEDGVLNLETGMNSRVDDGYDRLPAFIGQDVDVDLGFDVEAVAWGQDGVILRSKDGRSVSARAAISTLPVGVLKSGRVKFCPDLPLSKRSALKKLEMGPVVKLLLLFEERFWPKWAANIACGTGPVTLYWPTSYKSGRDVPVLTAYATGPRAAHLSKLGEEEARDVVLADLKRLFPRTDPAKLCTDARRIDWSTDPFACGGYTFIRPGGAGARALLGANDTPPLFWAGSATVWSPIAATVEAAFTSGLRAASEVSEFL